MGEARGQVRALVMEMNPRIRENLVGFLKAQGFEATGVHEHADLADLVKSGGHHVALLDLDALSEEAAPLMLQSIRSIDQHLCLICMTENPSVSGAVMAIKLGAFDYLKKGEDLEELRHSLEEATRALDRFPDRLKQLPALVGEKLRSRRAELGWSIRQVAAMSGLALSQISLAERGRAAVTIRTLYKITSALKMSMAELLEGI